VRTRTFFCAIFLLSGAGLLSACGDLHLFGADGYNIEVSWAANRETAVNRSGGGYRVYYSAQSDFDVNSATFLDVPYVSGALAPTSVIINGLREGMTYIKVVAYSSLKPPGSTNTATSEPSEQFAMDVR